ncbi:S41 family peptidase [Flavobacteriaceae bacterium]|nr:S41 family peptidase [Flavobacteriaceae bacterium]
MFYLNSFHSRFLENYFILFVLLLLIFGCKKEETLEATEVTVDELVTSQDTDDTAISLEGDLQISDFVWEGLNTYYYWQEQVPNLANSKISDEKAYAQFISENEEPEAFFESLKHPDDRFSWIQDDYEELENILQGVYASNGVEFGLTYACRDCNKVAGYVKYILKDSDASNKDINRGDVFIGVNGIELTTSNYRELLFSDELTYTLNMGTIEENGIVSNGIEIELTKEEEFETNPIQISKTIETSAGKVGYLMYNQFVIDKNADLNQAFGDFKSEGVTELVLDLRYNGGGSVRMCIELASMITGQFTDEIFSQEQWNSKLMEYLENRFGAESLRDTFVDTLTNSEESINSLSLDRVFILTTSDSASASELLINSLSSYIDVVHIGEKTTGKNVGSITVYDYIDNEGTKNPDHKYAMQPIVLKIANKDGFADYADGLEPDTTINEGIQNLGTLGDLEEPLLATAISLLTGTGKVSIPKSSISTELLINDQSLYRLQDMFLEKDWFKNYGKR